MGDPAEALRRGDARYTLLSAESFFRTQDDGTLVRASDLEAVGVAGSRFVHVVAASDSATLAGRNPLPDEPALRPKQSP